MKHRKNSECFPVSLFFASLDTGDWVLQLIHSWIWMCLIMTKWFIFFVNFSFLKDLRDTLNYTLYTSYSRKSFTIISCSHWWWWWWFYLKWVWHWIDQHFGALRSFQSVVHRSGDFSNIGSREGGGGAQGRCQRSTVLLFLCHSNDNLAASFCTFPYHLRDLYILHIAYLG